MKTSRTFSVRRPRRSMRLRTLGVLGVAASVGFVQTSAALVRPRQADAPFVAADRAPRTHRATAFEKAGSRSLPGLQGWTAIRDRDTEVPLRLWGAGPLAVGSVAIAATAEAAARRFLAAHIDVLAPGAQVSDFELVSNALSRNRDVRSVGFQQRAQGMRVLGGAIGFSFKADRLAMVSSTALPHVSVAEPVSRLAPAFAESRATAWLAAAGFAAAAKARRAPAEPERVIFSIVRPRTGAAADITYRVAEQVEVESTSGPGRWDVWVDAADGGPIARRSRIHYATGKLLYDVSDRHPNGTRGARPSIFTTHTVNGTPTTSSADGTITWMGTDAATVEPGLTGPFVDLTNMAGPRATAMLTLPADGTATWSLATSEEGDAQLTSFIYANEVKQFAKKRLDPSLAWLDQPLPVYVNEDGFCNAYSTGDDIHFFRSHEICQNTGRMSDVVYHEFGHSLHYHAVIYGVGDFDVAVSEGMSDFLSTLMTNDSGVGRGFFYDDAPLRELNPQGYEKRWPEDATGEPHNDGEIIGGAMWDLRAALEAKLGPEAGYEKTLDIFYAILQRSTGIPSTYAEALLADDNDGDLANGTPNQCEIDQAFGAHGLADPASVITIGAPVRDGFKISVPVSTGGNEACPGPRVTSAVVRWMRRGDAQTKELAMVENGDRYEAAIPVQPEGTVVQYQVLVTLSTGSTTKYPNNPADPFYEFYVGPVEIIRCFGFEDGFDGWTHATKSPYLDEWQVGAPAGLRGDPVAAHEGAGVLGVDLSRDGTYPAGVKTYAESPEIDLGGRTAIRLQLHRWLTIEDGAWDRARILVNGDQVWSNVIGQGEASHLDSEWRFADFDLAAVAPIGKVKVRFELESDPVIEFGGWTLDDVCIVATDALRCGNGTVEAGETCDDGNRTDGDGCSASCTDEAPPDSGETGCCSTGARPAGSLAISALVLGLALRRRRRRS